MKKILSLILALTVIFALTACGNTQDSQNTDISDTSSSTSLSADNVNKSSTDGIDLDLTALSSTVVYAEVYNMMTTPSDYLGKKVKMSGQFSVYQDEQTGNIYYACIIADATACCSQGLEFELMGDHTYPDDYPELGDNVTVTGTFETYDENGTMYCRLADAVMA